jgi:hypothetical protein
MLYTQNTDGLLQGQLSYGTSSLTLAGTYDPTKLHVFSDGASGSFIQYFG